jgi:hypothetical protein
LTMGPHQLHNPLGDLCDQDRLPSKPGVAKALGNSPSGILIPTA